jgi:U4/U6 small nuclear ribonucleoprotein PRP4
MDLQVWDLRSRRCLYTIPAHTSLLSSVHFEPHHGNFLLTSSYDNLVKLWSAKDFTLLKTLAGHEGKVMFADVAAGEELLVGTVGYDRTLKYWSPEEAVEDLLNGAVMELG